MGRHLLSCSPLLLLLLLADYYYYGGVVQHRKEVRSSVFLK
jgi:hypothetical protein